MSASLRRLRFGLATLLGRPRGWFIPHRYAESCVAPAGYDALEPIFAAAQPAMRALLDAAEPHAADFARFGGPPPNPRFEQDWFPRLDAVAAYTMLRARKPARLVEVGSGHSTRVFARAIADGGLATRITAIDPQPRADIAGLGIEIRREPVQRAPRGVFDRLSSGDMLAVDSSHVLMPGSDVDLLFADVLPRLPSGVVVHVHDIFLPDAYPASWAWRGYNEQNALAGFLSGGGWRVLWSSRYVATRMQAAFRDGALAALPLSDGAFETSLWLERC
ncbi:MAG: class I SAM-dependent methyltransferase [Alphaproteobacteria bacterium]|nr:class I SAM-dependent methyltransferase [Alphaproteobacteria bacterium]